MSIELKEEKGKSKIRQKDGTYVEMGLKTADFQSVDEILSVPGCMCNLMPAAMWDEERKFMYKGKDGKDYTSFEEVKSVDEFYTQQENPLIEKGRSR